MGWRVRALAAVAVFFANGCFSTTYFSPTPIGRAGAPGATASIRAYTTTDHERHPCRGAVRFPRSRTAHDLVFVCQGLGQRVIAPDSTVLSVDTQKTSAGRVLLDAILVGTFVFAALLAPRDDCRNPDFCFF